MILTLWRDWQWHRYRCKRDGRNPWKALWMNKNIISLSRNGFIRRWFRRLWLNRLYDVWLARNPRVKWSNQITYRAVNTEGVSLALEMLEGGNCYPLNWMPDRDGENTTFADLGCNVGYFPCWLAMQRGWDISGIMVDANINVIPEAEWHVQANDWIGRIAVRCGLVGADGPFFIAPSNTCSTAHLHTEIAPKYWTKHCRPIQVQPISVFKLWSKHMMTGTRCNILKIDIEGAEYDFLRRERDFMVLVDNVLIECHTYVEPFATACELLKELGFGEPTVFDKGSRDIVAAFKRK